MDLFDTLTLGLLICAVLTAAFAGVSAWQSRVAAQEMARARAVAVLPKLALHWYEITNLYVFPRIINVGPGPALNVDVVVTFVGRQGAGPDERYPWKTALLASGEGREFWRPADDVANAKELAARFERVRLEGSMTDALGHRHDVVADLGDVAEWLEMWRRVRWDWPQAEKRLAKALGEEFGKP